MPKRAGYTAAAGPHSTSDAIPHLGRKRELLLSRARRVHTLYEAGELGGQTHEVHPSVPRESRENYLYFTLAPSLNFQRNSKALWESARATYDDVRTRFVFFPENVERGIDSYKEALTRHRLALQPNRHSSIWFTLSSALRDSFQCDPRSLLESCDYSVPRVKALLSERKRDFPYLSGPKLSNYWLYMLLCFTDATLSPRRALNIIPDTHVVKASVRLGLVPQHVAATPALIADLWDFLLQETELAPVDLHAPLWRWSRGGFLPDIS